MRDMSGFIRSEAWYTLWRLMVAGDGVAIAGECLFQYLRVRS